MIRKLLCWLGLGLNTYLISYNFMNKQGSGFGRVLFKASKASKEVINTWEHQIKMDFGGDTNIVILNIVRLDDD